MTAVVDVDANKGQPFVKPYFEQEKTPPQDPKETEHRRLSRRIKAKMAQEEACKMLPKCLTYDRIDKESKRGTKRRRGEPEDKGSVRKIKAEEKEDSAQDEENSPPDFSQGLSEYELERLENIRQNQAFLSSLRLPQITAALKPKPKPVQRGLKKEKTVREVLPPRKSLRLQKKEAEMPNPSEMTAAFTENTVAEVSRKPEGPIPMVPVNLDTGSLPEELVKLWNEDSIKLEQGKSEVKRYQSVLQGMFVDSTSVVKVVKERIFSAAFHPCSTSLLMAAGDKWGSVGIWNLGAEWGDDGVLAFQPHSRPVTCMAFTPSHPSSLVSTSYDGSARCTDLEKAMFDEVYRSDACLKSFDFLSQDCSTLLIGEWDGDVVIVDRRTPGTSYESIHTMDPKTLRCVHVHPVQKQYFVVAESSGVHIYDARCLKKTSSQPVSGLHGHSLSISAAFFSPSTGNRVLTTCMDNTIRVFDTSAMVSSVPRLSSTKHFMQTGRWLSKLSAVWDPKQEDCFVIGSMDRPRRIKVYHESGKLVHSFQNEEYLTTVCSITAFHPNRNALLGGNASGRLHVFADRH
ncbi:WD repeat-containing protein 76 [Chanos chanos]|uniref:WD repeat-containing protein 76 n=1 Tax=Chanos chanos TaxID=29144 RepID=A0A6J2ULS2_CHACN|nr:WD repeat-containing protein 76 [Chanos chanos]